MENQDISTIIIKKKKKKKKYSKGLKQIQKSDDQIVKVGRTLAKSVAKGLKDYQKYRNKSARKKRNGIVVDYIPNVGKGIRTLLEESSSIPFKITKVFTPKSNRKIVKKILKRRRFF